MENDVLPQLSHYKDRLLGYVQSKLHDPNLAEDVFKKV